MNETSNDRDGKPMLIEKLKNALLDLSPAFLYRFLAFYPTRKLSLSNLPDTDHELLILKYILERDFIFFDVGANLGVYSYVACNAIDEKNVHIFEPHPQSFKRLAKAFRNSNVHNIALTDTVSNAKSFKVPILDGGAAKSRGTLEVDYIEPDEKDRTVFSVPVSTLDEFARELWVDFIKIDVEGHETKVIEGGLAAINRCHPIIQIEIEQRHHPDSDCSSSLINRIKGLNYACYVLDSTKLQLVPFERDLGDVQQMEYFGTSSYINNFYFFPSEKYNNVDIKKVNTCIRKEVSRC